MTSNLRSMIFGVGCLAVALGLVSCSSSDSGETLSVEFTTPPSMVISVTTRGTAATATTASTPDKWTGSGKIEAVVVYRGKKTLTYKWDINTPGLIGHTDTFTKASAKVDLTGQTTFISTSQVGALNIGNGIGTAILEVYEDGGVQYKKASTTFTVSTGFSG